MITRADATRLRAIAATMLERNHGTFLQTSAEMDAAELRSIADAMDEHLRPRTRREMEGEARRARTAGLWGSFRRLWNRAA